MKLAFLTFGIFLSGLLYSQNVDSLAFDLNVVSDSKITLNDDWLVEMDGSNFYISNGKLMNKSEGKSDNLHLKLMLSTLKYMPITGNVIGYTAADIPFDGLSKNSSITGIRIQNKNNNVYKDGEYYPILILTENDVVKDIVQLRKKVQISNNAYALTDIEQTNQDGFIETDFSALTDQNLPIKVTTEINNQIKFDDNWEVSIDFKNFLVDVTQGTIINNSNENLEELKIDVFLTKDKEELIYKDFPGILISTMPLEPVQKGLMLGAKMKSNLRTIPESGTYYIVLFLSKIGANGEELVQNYRTFDNPISF